MFSAYTRFLWLKPLLAVMGAVCVLSACPAEQSQPEASAKAPAEIPAGAAGERIRYGQALVSETVSYLGSGAKDPALRLAGNHLNCSQCHLANGTQADAMPFIGIARRFPAYYAPLDKKISLAERVQACFERSLNGKPLPAKELQAFEAYLDWLSQQAEPSKSALPELKPPARAANPQAGQKLYAYHCAACHGSDGQGVRVDDKQASLGYTFPPLWGSDSFSQASNMARQLIATRYIKANMPLGRAVLTSEEAYDIAAWVLSKPRPAFAHAAQDYPNPQTKPADVPYGPYADGLPEARHRLGPF